MRKLKFIRAIWHERGYILVCTHKHSSEQFEEAVLIWCPPSEIFNRPQKQGVYKFYFTSRQNTPAFCDCALSSCAPVRIKSR